MKTPYTYYSDLEPVIRPQAIAFTMLAPNDGLWKAFIDQFLLKLVESKVITWSVDDAYHVATLPDMITKTSSKDWAALSTLKAYSEAGLLDKDGSIQPAETVLNINGLEVVPNLQTEYLATSKYTRRKMGFNALHASKEIPLTPLGKKVPDAKYRQLCSEAVEVCNNPDAKAFEEGEMYPARLMRGLFFPVMHMARSSLYRNLWDSKFDMLKHSECVVPVSEFHTLKTMDDVWLENPRGGAGFPFLDNLTTEGVPYRKSPVYIRALNRAEELMRILSQKIYTRRVLMAMFYPHQVGVRFQGYGRGIVMYDKSGMLIQSLAGQPYTVALEKEPWYASGDMIDRIHLARSLLSGRIRHAADGDDGVYVPEFGEWKGLTIGTDFSAMESGMSWNDFRFCMQSIKTSMISDTLGYTTAQMQNILYNLKVAELNVGLTLAVGTVKREAGVGENSGSPFTHSDETITHKGNQQYVDTQRPKDVEELTSAFIRCGREIRSSAQFIPRDGHVLLAKRISDGTIRGSYGSVVRAISSAYATEGPWDIPDGFTQDEWEAGRVLSIGINIYYSPGYPIWLKALKAGSFCLSDVNMKNVYKLAMRYVEKRRGGPQTRKRESGAEESSLERHLLNKVVKDLMTLA